MNLSKCSPWMKVKYVFLVLLIAGISFAQEALPDGWHRPTLAEAKGQWRKQSRTRFLEVRGDFNGDGRVDLAELLISDSGKQCGLFVRFAGSDGQWQALWQPDIPALIDIGIDIVHPGKYETLCGSDPSVCAAGLPKALDLAYSAIQFFSYGSASSIFYWDRRSKKFLIVPMSD